MKKQLIRGFGEIMDNFKTRLYKRFKLSKKFLLAITIAPFLISYPLYKCEYNLKKTYLIEAKVYSNEDLIQIYKMIPTYRWVECEKDDLNFKTISNYSVLLIPMQASMKISLRSKDAEYGKSFITKVIEKANCVYGQSKKYEIEYLKKIESITILRLNRANKILDIDNVIDVNNYLIEIKELYKLKGIKTHLDQQASDKLSIEVSLYSKRWLNYALIVILLFVCEFLIFLLGIFVPISAKNV